MTVAEKDVRANRWRRNPPELRELITRVKDQHPLLVVLGAAGVRTRKQGHSYVVANCPFPNHEDSSPSFKVKLSAPDRFYCYGCCASGDVLDFVHYFYGKDTFDEQVRFLTGKSLRELVRGSSVQELQQAACDRDRRRRELQELHRLEEKEQRGVTDEMAGSTYEALLDQLSSSPQHREQFKKRGIAFEEALDLGYRTLPVDRVVRIRLCEELLSDGYNLRGVPGFFQLPKEAGTDAGRWCVGGTGLGMREIRDGKSGCVWGVEGLLVPTCDEAGRIVRLKLRNDPPPDDAPAWVVELWPTKYMALSSKDRIGGSGAGLRLHYVGPVDGGNFAGTLWVTEGEIKADIAAMSLKARVVGVSGVGQCSELVIEAMRRGGFHRLFVAMDSEVKGHVQLAIARLCRLAIEAGFEPLVVVWDGKLAKGIDDLLVDGEDWQAVPHKQWWESLSNGERGSVRRRLAGACVG
jgi:hypothetical protein